jgi:hypothetical protein
LTQALEGRWVKTLPGPIAPYQNVTLRP